MIVLITFHPGKMFNLMAQEYNKQMFLLRYLMIVSGISDILNKQKDL